MSRARDGRGAALAPWRSVLAPYDDVLTGGLAPLSVDLHEVARPARDGGGGPGEAVEFFRRTYLTAGLRDLIDGALRRLAGDEHAPAVLGVQTTRGGGKSHALVALWHLLGPTPWAAYPPELRELLAAHGDGPGPACRVALAGRHLAPTGELRGEQRVHTLWGDLAWQLGGPAAHALVAGADRAGTNPGAGLRDLVARHAPALILVDDWPAYAAQLPGRDERGRDVAGGTFDTQLTVARALADAVRATAGTVLVVSLPGPEEVVADAAARELREVLSGLSVPWAPPSPREQQRIVGRRLFPAPDGRATAAIATTAGAFADHYRRHRHEFPPEASGTPYEERIRETYPLHPELLHSLGAGWAERGPAAQSLTSLRGLLRVTSAAVRAVWESGDPGPLILPGTIPQATGSPGSGLAGLLAGRWAAVVEHEVDGEHAEPARIDRRWAGSPSAAPAVRLARTVFLATAARADHQADHQTDQQADQQAGVETSRVLLGSALPGEAPADLRATLDVLADRLPHLHSEPGRHWYSLRPSLAGWARERAERWPQEEVWSEVARRLRAHARSPGDFAAVHVCPASSADVPDHDQVRLVVVPPALTHVRGSADSPAAVFARVVTERKGAAHRIFRNMVVHLAADADRVPELDRAVRAFLAWSAVLARPALRAEERRRATERLRRADETVESRLALTYRWALVPEQPDPTRSVTLAEVPVGGSGPRLAERVSHRLRKDGRLNTTQAAAAIRVAIERIPHVWQRGHVSLGGLWQLYATYPYLPRLRDRTVLSQGVRHQPQSWQHDGFALADGFDGERYAGLVAGSGELAVRVTNGTLLVRPDVAAGQLAPTTPARAAPAGPPPPPVTRFVGTKTLDPTRAVDDLVAVAEEVVAHLARAGGRVDVALEATAPGFDAATVRTVLENAAALRFDEAGFEVTAEGE